MLSKKPLRVPDDILLLVRRLHPDLKRKIRAGLDELVKDPEAGKALRDDLEGLRSFRVSRFRVIYRIGKGLIEVVTIGPRRTVYEETLRRLEQEKAE
ncbi:MAG: type II toxin-antitoxin system RelE/ParE family toxin [Nitrospirae bacterium]|nr:type II toxin-antitoxin system RelE/ParE family toxin [Nitrospirota bacterium]